ncbi:MAG: glycosyltransferase family 4 protein [Nanoarchaeota archaeon]|nr:glycosyltransferase family 4 protein [Nanoarchaeota archaeon]
MKIAIVSTFLGQKLQGGEISSFLLAKGLSKTENVFVVTTKITQKFPFRCYSMPVLKRVPNPVLIIGNKWLDFYMTKRLVEIFKKEKPDVIHVQDFFMMIASIKAARQLRIPVILTVRSTTFACNLSICLEGNRIPFVYTKKQYKKWLFDSLNEAYGLGFLSYFLFPWFYEQNNRMRKWFKQIDYYITVSDFVKSQVIKSGIDWDRVKTIKVQKPDWEPIDLSDPNKIMVFTAGALTKFKGFDYLIKAFRKVVEQYSNVQLRIAGDGSEKRKLIALIKRLKLSENVILLGKISYDKVREEYAKSSFVICPSIGPESLSRIIFEAFAMKKTIIATDVGGSSELVISNKTGLLIEPYNEEGMARAIIKLIEKPTLAEKMGKIGCVLINKEANKEIVVRNHVLAYSHV